MTFAAALEKLLVGQTLTIDEMANQIGAIVDGEILPDQIAAFLVALRNKGEGIGELVGAARAMRVRALPVRTPAGIWIDTCGTGGDGKSTLNVSTLAALVVATGGGKVAKHGNRASSSQSGSADLLEALGVDVSMPVDRVERSMAELGIGFLFAPFFHAATQKVAAVRRQLGGRTIFNLLGPLTNPAGVRRQLVGVFDPSWLTSMAEALERLGSERVMVVHGEGGYDEFAPEGATDVVELRDEQISRRKLSPSDFGLSETVVDGLLGGAPNENAERAKAILCGAPGAGRNCVVMTAAATFHLIEDCSLKDGASRAKAILDRGVALNLVNRLGEISRGLP